MKVNQLRRRPREKIPEETLDIEPEENSPYAEVRAAVLPVDDPLLPQNTIRMWAIGFVVTTVANAANTILSLHSPTGTLTPFVCTVFAWPVGRLWEYIVPRKTIFGYPLNPGRFNIKEHALITVMSAASLGPSYSAVTVVTIEQFYKEKTMPKLAQVLYAIATQAIGLAMAGIVRRIFIYPAAMIWPNSLVNVTLLTNIHVKSNYVANGWRISRLSLFAIVAVIGTMYQWVPSFLMQMLSYFDFGPWIAPANSVVNQLFGVNSGLALLPVTFDWNQVSSYLGSPLVPPLGTFINVGACLLFMFWLAAPILHFANVWYGAYLPMVSSSIFDRFQNQYDVTRVVDASGSFNDASYNSYSPLFMSSTMSIAYGLGMASITSLLAHTLLFDLKDIVRYWKTSSDNISDIHMRLMRAYPETHMFWYVALLVLCMALLIIVSKVYTDFNVGSLFLAVVLAAVILIPSAFIYAISNVTVGLNVMAELIIGYIQPGSAVSLMMFKTLTYYTNVTSMTYLSNMKFGHYLKLAPRVVFAVQLIGCVWGGLVQIFAIWWAQGAIPDLCDPRQAVGYSCPLASVFYSSSAIWGVIGSQRTLKIYWPLLYFFILGTAMPVLSWLWLRKWPRSLARYINWPVFFNSSGALPPATPYNYAVFVGIGFVFSFWIKRNWFSWWAKYNYTLSCGLDLAVALGQLIIFCVATSAHVSPPNWWGNVGAFDTKDGRAEPLIVLEHGQSFGPSKW